MGLIRILPADVADQIAAGEVVERPASVVKELIENAIDAGACFIEVQVVDGGTTRITVIDDGRGMEGDDALLCFSRHATSKLTSAADLRALQTFGFRGEALAAIASVARVRLLTRPAAAGTARDVRADAGQVSDRGEAGGPRGTRIDVENLFFNVPARLKFLKSVRTEAGAVEDALIATALAKPTLGLRLVVDGRTTFDLEPSPPDTPLDHPTRIERAVRCLGKQVRPWLYPLRATTDLLGIEGYVVAPLETRRDLTRVHLSVNGRPVTDRALVQAVRAAFRTLLEVGRQPILALDLRIDPDVVDVNVHPRKAEVRFADPRRVSGHLIAMLSEFLATTPWLQPRHHQAPPPRRVILHDSSMLVAPQADPLDTTHRERVREALLRAQASRSPFSPDTAQPALPTLASRPGRGGAARFSDLRVVGQVGATYLVLEGHAGMVVMDQHAAHERVVFERLRAQWSAGRVPCQPLLLPQQLEVDSTEMAALADPELQGHLLSIGLEVDLFGPTSALIKAIPRGLDAAQAERITRDALAEFGRLGETTTISDRVDAVCACLACHAAIRAGDLLSPEGIRQLLGELDSIDLGAHCPHGRPVVRAVDYTELARWFHR